MDIGRRTGNGEFLTGARVEATSEDVTGLQFLRQIAKGEVTLEVHSNAVFPQATRMEFIRSGWVRQIELACQGPWEPFVTRLVDDLAEITRNFPDDEVVTAPTSISVPLIMGMKLSVDDPNLWQMYLALLARASNVRYQGSSTLCGQSA